MFKILNKLTYITHLPFEMSVGQKKITKKRTTLYFIKSDNKILTTELSPFPGFSTDTLESLEYKLEQVLEDHNIVHNNSHINFCLYELNLKKRWNEKYNPEIIKSNKLIHYNQNIDFELLKDFQTLKIKIDNNLLAIKSFFKENATKLKPFKIRLDANARLSIKELKAIYSYCLDSGISIEYFEEPLFNINEYKSCDIPFALDENIRFFNYFKNAKMLILKPTQFYSDIIWNNKEKKMIVISSTFDSIFTHATLNAMALRYKDIDHGLDNSNYNDLGFDFSLKDVFPTLSEKHYKQIINKS